MKLSGIFSAVLFVSLAFLTACSPKTTGGAMVPEMPDGAKEGEISLLLSEGALPATLEQSFVNYGLKALKRTSRDENRWLFSFNPEKIKTKKVLGELMANPLVVSGNYVMQ